MIVSWRYDLHTVTFRTQCTIKQNFFYFSLLSFGNGSVHMSYCFNQQWWGYKFLPVVENERRQAGADRHFQHRGLWSVAGWRRSQLVAPEANVPAMCMLLRSCSVEVHPHVSISNLTIQLHVLIIYQLFLYLSLQRQHTSKTHRFMISMYDLIRSCRWVCNNLGTGDTVSIILVPVCRVLSTLAEMWVSGYSTVCSFTFVICSFCICYICKLWSWINNAIIVHVCWK